jgi:hypothetical protein
VDAAVGGDPHAAPRGGSNHPLRTPSAGRIPCNRSPRTRPRRAPRPQAAGQKHGGGVAVAVREHGAARQHADPDVFGVAEAPSSSFAAERAAPFGLARHNATRVGEEAGLSQIAQPSLCRLIGEGVADAKLRRRDQTRLLLSVSRVPNRGNKATAACPIREPSCEGNSLQKPGMKSK